MTEHAVRERSVRRRHDHARAGHAGLGLTAERLYVVDRLLARSEPRARHNRGERVEEMELRAIDHRFRRRTPQRRR
jgi:hypothetical protein